MLFLGSTFGRYFNWLLWSIWSTENATNINFCRLWSSFQAFDFLIVYFLNVRFDYLPYALFDSLLFEMIFSIFSELLELVEMNWIHFINTCYS